MKKSDWHVKDNQDERLEFPVDSAFAEKKVHLPPHLILKRSRERLGKKLAEPDFMQRRLEEKVDMEFRL